MAAVEHGRCGALDHDFTKCSITPSVTIFCDIPEDSFYRGSVHVGIKNSVFEPSDMLHGYPSFLANVLKTGGGDHNVTHISAQISMFF